MPFSNYNSYTNITGQATTVVKAGSGQLFNIILNTPVATSVITLWDSLSASGTKIGTITVPASPQPVSLFYDIKFNTGLTVQTATASSDITVAFA